ncbi:uncharacterized protein OCT59_013948 [Rhizophagus irregularis]|uniref:Uncharacterized protein n=3 Tax=Rhizophagus irregularis TaxID=588596 RepID=A0A015KDC1_RHIIW|nr:hypothetical protein GLOIN_2v1764011 [Rhizophagus irregularis DAOM 181602=DAOM 197198]EXX77575.1 hypothetical protein RirG_022590 [Rhizophagus irregularis DAOM 197198w]POG80765.1 hypothetical protein GLOIN_2v1764011 [Rhizophagus irregularis DAOM 181602=DAOM 197198]UZO21561.1 hypothetical protein OCT59_013948 [Rhizophagus irregularis]GBC23150.1 hypothetical protein GLOIN_2v1764011 [Rhizophagus irregularis DAOM 181602=DAOM 197198]|eukprot:XP_025187631.1 hypothetical protein GLOIN_2v1764011 [Rhizophagus irregularis DAOM 181602=DAOM 197198]
MSKIDNDVLLIIFDELKNDNGTLFTCALVNRQWCKMAIPILWKDPIKNQQFNEQLLDIIKYSLPYESKKLLLSHGIDITSNLQLRKKPLFDYIKYCKYLRFNKINEYANLMTKSIKETDYFLIKREIFKFYISKCSSIKFLDLNFTERYYQLSHDDLMKYQLLKFPGSINCFSELMELHCDSNIDSSIFYGFAEICKFIQKIYIYQLYDNPGLIELIKVQKNLKKFKYTASKFIKYKINEFTGIGKALENNSETLLHFKALDDLYGNCFIPGVFSKFKNLEKLILFRLCYCFQQYEFEEQLSFTSFPKLKVIHIQDASIYTVKKIIEKTDGNLIKIAIYDIEYKKDYDNKPFQDLIQSIYKNCPNLKFLRLEIKDEILEDFEKLLITCNQLEGLVIESCRWKMYNNYNIKNLLLLLAKSSPINLFKFKFYYYWDFDQISLNLFFENWRGRTPLKFYMVDTDKFLSIFENYKNEGIIERYEDIEDIYFKCFEW